MQGGAGGEVQGAAREHPLLQGQFTQSAGTGGSSAPPSRRTRVQVMLTGQLLLTGQLQLWNTTALQDCSASRISSKSFPSCAESYLLQLRALDVAIENLLVFFSPANQKKNCCCFLLLFFFLLLKKPVPSALTS